MIRLPKAPVLLAGVALMVAVAVCVESRRQLLDVQRQLQGVTAANEFLKKTLGEMTVSIAAKDRQIDRLEHAGCDGQGQTPPANPSLPPQSRVSGAGAVTPGNGRAR